MQDNLIQVKGMILSSMPVGESDRRLVLLTKELGRLSCFARSARKPTNPLVGKTRPFSFGQFDLYPGHDAYTLKTAEITEYFEPIVQDPVKSAAGSCVLELASRVTQENADGTEWLNLIYAALRAIASGRMETRQILLAYYGKALSIEGELPEFRTCAKCRKEVKTAVFKPSWLDIVCTDCAPDEDRHLLSSGALSALSFIRTTPSGKLFSFVLSESVYRETNDVIRFFLERMTGRPFASEELLNVLLENDAKI